MGTGRRGHGEEGVVSCRSPGVAWLAAGCDGGDGEDGGDGDACERRAGRSVPLVRLRAALLNSASTR